MRGTELLEDMEFISDVLIEEAMIVQSEQKGHGFWHQRWGTMAACITVAAVSAAVFWTHSRADVVKEESKEDISINTSEDYDVALEAEMASEDLTGNLSSDERSDIDSESNTMKEAQNEDAHTNISFDDNTAADLKSHSTQTDNIPEADMITIIIDEFPPKQMQQSGKQGGAVCYKAPEKGEWFYYIQLQRALEYYDGAQNTMDVINSPVYAYQVIVEVFGDRTEDESKTAVYGILAGSDSGKKLLMEEYQRLLGLGYQVSLSEDYQLTGVFTKEELDNFKASSDYGYTFGFESEY